MVQWLKSKSDYLLSIIKCRTPPKGLHEEWLLSNGYDTDGFVEIIEDSLRIARWDSDVENDINNWVVEVKGSPHPWGDKDDVWITTGFKIRYVHELETLMEMDKYVT